MSTREAVIVSTARTPIGRAYKGAFNATPSPTLAAHAIRAAVERAGRRSGRGRRRDHGRRAPAGRAGDDRPHRGAARRAAGHRRRHVDRPAMRLRPDGDRHRGQAGDRRPDADLRRRRRRIDLDGADAGDAARRRSRADRDAQGRLHADDRHRRGGGEALRHQPRRRWTNMRSSRSSAPPPPRRPARSTTRSSPATRPWRSRTRRPARSRKHQVTIAKDEGNRPETTLEGLSSLQPVMGPDATDHRRQCQPALRRRLGLRRHGGRPRRRARPQAARPLCRHGGGGHRARRDGHRPGLRGAEAARAVRPQRSTISACGS